MSGLIRLTFFGGGGLKLFHLMKKDVDEVISLLCFFMFLLMFSRDKKICADYSYCDAMHRVLFFLG